MYYQNNSKWFLKAFNIQFWCFLLNETECSCLRQFLQQVFADLGLSSAELCSAAGCLYVYFCWSFGWAKTRGSEHCRSMQELLRSIMSMLQFAAADLPPPLFTAVAPHPPPFTLQLHHTSPLTPAHNTTLFYCKQKSKLMSDILPWKYFE